MIIFQSQLLTTEWNQNHLTIHSFVWLKVFLNPVHRKEGLNSAPQDVLISFAAVEYWSAIIIIINLTENVAFPLYRALFLLISPSAIIVAVLCC